MFFEEFNKKKEEEEKKTVHCADFLKYPVSIFNDQGAL